jgi:hypothetical protein
MVSYYRLNIRGSTPAEAKYSSFSLCVQRSAPEAHPASYSMGTGGRFPRGKALPWHDPHHSTPSRTEVKNEYKLYFLSLSQAWQ